MDVLKLDQLETQEIQYENSIRPSSFDKFVGQIDFINRLKIAIEAASQRDEPIPNTCLVGQSGFGKTSLASIIAKEAGVDFKSIFAPSLKTVTDLYEILIKLKPKEVFFCDELHNMDKNIEECLYSAIEDYIINIKLKNKEIVKIKLQPFCFVGATTKPGKLSTPLRDRFDILYTMQPYSKAELCTMIDENAKKLKIDIETPDVIETIADRSRGVPRIGNRLLRRVRDYAQIKNNGMLTMPVTEEAFKLEGIDKFGLTSVDKKYLYVLWHNYQCGPAGIDALAASMGEDRSTLSDFIEPYLISVNYISRTGKGRLLSAYGMEYILKYRNELQ